MKLVRLTVLGLSLVAALFAVACSSPEPTATPVSAATATPVSAATATPVSAATSTPTATSTPEPPTAKLLTLSNDSPHVTVIDAETNLVIKTADIPDFLKWAWNDDNNHFDGQNVWLGMKYPEADDAVVIALNVDTLEVSSRLSVGKEAKNIYMGKATKSGILHIGKQASAEVVTIDTNSAKVLETWDTVPVNGGVVCDADIGIGPDGVERFYYPTQKGDTVVVINASTGATIAEVATPGGATPLMHTNAPDGRMWVQESGSNTNAVFDPVTLELVKRFAAAKGPVVGTFSPDGEYAYIGHFGDPIVQVIDTETLAEVTRITVGLTPSKLAVHPNGDYIYAIASKEARVFVIETDSWKVTGTIALANNPGGMFLWKD
jgi:YVTN family beta-propeller protein